MIDSYSLAEYSSHILSTADDAELEQRLGLYRVFLKLYEHHRGLLDEILDLENTAERWRVRTTIRYVQAVAQGQHVYLITNLLNGKTQWLHQPQQVWIIGRDRKAALFVQEKRLSRRHAAIQYVKNEGFYLIDLNSTNGSFLNGEPVRQSALLQDGDQVRLGSLVFQFFTGKAGNPLEAIEPELLAQINAARQVSPAATNDTTHSDAGEPDRSKDDTCHPNSAEDTSMFLQVCPEPSSEALCPQFTTAQQGAILDRFFGR